jgi:two-component system, NarL family, response regulator LiaR
LSVIDRLTVLIADSHVLPQRRFKNFLAQQKDIQVVGEAVGGRLLNQVEALQPHILMLDMRRPKMDELKVLPRIHAKSPRTKILLRAEYFAENFIAKALEEGVHGCILSTASPTELVQVIRAVHAGEFWIQRKLLSRVVKNLRQRVDLLEGSPAELRGILSDREHEVVIWAIQGMTNKEIAAQLGVSAKTVKTHLQNVFRKLNISRRVQLSALSLGLASDTLRTTPQPASSIGITKRKRP